MKKVTLKTKDVFDLASVMTVVLKDQSANLDFKEILKLQKSVNYMLSMIDEFAKKLESLAKEKETYVDTANEKIKTYKAGLQKESEDAGEVDDKYKEKLEVFVQDRMDEIDVDIRKEVGPKYDELYAGLGDADTNLEFEEEVLKILVSNFELYAKELYNNKTKMVEVYEILSK